MARKLEVLIRNPSGQYASVGTDIGLGVWPDSFDPVVYDGSGVSAFGFTLHRLPGIAWPDVAGANEVTLFADGVKVADGRILEDPRDRGGDDDKIHVSCEGWQASLSDDPIRLPFLDTRIDTWRDWRSNAQADLAVFGTAPGVSTDAGVTLSLAKGAVLSATTMQVAAYYDAGASSILGLSITAKWQGEAASTVTAYIEASVSGASWTTITSVALTSTSSSWSASSNVSASLASARYLRVRLASSGAFTTGVEHYFAVTGLKVSFQRVADAFVPVVSGATNATPIVISTSPNLHTFQTGDRVVIAGVGGNVAANGSWFVTVLTTTTFSLDGSAGSGAYTTGGSATKLLTASDVVRTVAAACPKLSTDYSRVSATTFGIPDLVGRRDAARAFLDAANAYHCWQWWIDLDRRIVFRAAPATPTLVVEAGAAAEFENASGQSAGDAYSRVVVEYQDAAGLDQEVVRTQTGTIWDRQGYPRGYVLSTGARLTSGAAQQIGDTFLAAHKSTPLRGTLRVYGTAISEALSDRPVPITELGRHLGDAIMLANEIDPDTGALGRITTIAGVDIDLEADTATLSLATRRDYLEGLFNRFALFQAA